MELFSNVERTDLRGSDYGENPYRYLNVSGRPMARRIREFLSAAFAHYPTDAQLDIKRRLMANRPDAHLAALLELVVFAFLKRQGHDVEVHPAVAGTSARPDFGVRTASGTILVECTTANGSEETTNADRRRFQAVDALDQIVSDRWSVGYVSETTGSTPLRTARFVHAVREWLATLDWPEITASLAAGDDLPELAWADEDWSIRLQAIPLKPDAGPTGARGMFMSEVTNVDVTVRVRRAVVTKTGAYGSDLRMPLVIVVVPGVEYGRDEHLLEALLGDRLWNLMHRTREVRQPTKPTAHGGTTAACEVQGHQPFSMRRPSALGTWLASTGS